MHGAHHTFALALSLALTFATGGAMASPPENAPSSALTAPDQEFLKKASTDGAAEVSMGRLAIRKSSSSRVKSLAETLVGDHTKANRDLAELADRKHVALGADNAPPSDAMDHLVPLTGDAFDRAYVSTMIAAHKKAISLFEEASHGRDPDLSAFALRTLPTLEHPLHMAEALEPAKP
ncbi:DUF4142 domain-containing protein [Dyella sp. ASV21]|uniref:DUF4142 domain-containing protein n=1 Tax=Dyella sp. ASV21 TaxID=2795114 RepID=UPI0018EC2D7C|nr:DUF4142 domain-containing protein [Dyella sp. ASV21]